MNKRFSVDHIIEGIQKTITRFPAPSLIALVGTVIGIILLHNDDLIFLPKLFFTLTLALPLYVSAAIFLEQTEDKNKKLFAYGAVTLFVFAHLTFFSKDLFAGKQLGKFYIEYLMWLSSSVILLTIAPFIKTGKEKILDFWHYNKQILYAALGTIFYSGAIYAGLSVALLSVNTLFDMHLDGERWAELFIVISGLFSTTFLLSRYPDLKNPEAADSFPKELKIFSYYVLTPLVAIYFLILYAYTGKVVFTWEWPKGIISSMILGFSILGIVTYALLYPLITKEDMLQNISKIFFIALIPQVGVLFWAVWLRVSEYGITEKRYLIIIFGVWLLAMSIYFLISKVKNIKIIPTTLILILSLTSFGPWGAMHVSENSQIGRLERILVKNKMMVDGNVAKAGADISVEDKREISEIVSYLDEYHGFKGIQNWFGQDLDSLARPRSSQVTALMGIEYMYAYQPGNYFYLSAGAKSPYGQNLDISGFSYLVRDFSEVKAGKNTYKFTFDEKTLQYVVHRNGNVLTNIPTQDFLNGLIQRYRETGKTEFTSEEMTYSFENANLKVKMFFASINSNEDVVNVDSTILVNFK